MNIREFRALTDGALRDEGFEPLRLMPRKMWVWALQDGDIVRFFHAHAYRRPWGFVFSGFIGIEIPALREWLVTVSVLLNGVIRQPAFRVARTIHRSVFETPRGFSKLAP